MSIKLPMHRLGEKMQSGRKRSDGEAVTTHCLTGTDAAAGKRVSQKDNEKS